jgi:hypothetical protein
MAGGSSDQTTQSTSNNYDQRQVVTNTTNINDLSDHSTKNTYNDLSDHSTKNTYNDLSDHSVSLWDSSTHIDNHAVTNNDLSNRSVTNIDNHAVTNNTTNYLDGGAVAGGLKVAGDAVAAVAGAAAGGAKVAGDSVAAMLQTVLASLGLASSTATAAAANEAHAYDYADQIFHGALDAVNKNDARALDAFDRAAKMEEGALVASQAASKLALDQVQNAYADAKGTTQAQQKIMLAVLAVAGVAVLAGKMGK